MHNLCASANLYINVNSAAFAEFTFNFRNDVNMNFTTHYSKLQLHYLQSEYIIVIHSVKKCFKKKLLEQ